MPKVTQNLPWDPKGSVLCAVHVARGFRGSDGTTVYVPKHLRDWKAGEKALLRHLSNHNNIIVDRKRGQEK